MASIRTPGPAFERARRALIAAAVTLHFALGTLCFAKPPSALLELPGLAPVLDLYRQLDFAQTSRMFAPPSQTIDELGYALRLPGGWTPMQGFDGFLRAQARGRFTLPRGFIRVADHLRHPFLPNRPLREQPFMFHYFQQLSAFFCFG